jgi:hypothetical protein
MNLDIFLKNRNLEAVDEENAAKRRIQEYMRQQVKILNQEVNNKQELTDNEKDEFNKVYLSFMSTLDDYVNKIEGDLDSIKNVGVLTYRYNLLSNILSKINYQVLDQQQKTPITSMLDDLIPKLEELQRYASVNNFTDQTQINNMLKGFQSHTFPLLKVSPVVLKEVGVISDTDYITNSKIIKDNTPFIIKNKQYLSKAEQKIFDNNQLAVSQLDRTIKVEGKVTTDSTDKIAKFAKLYRDYKQTIESRLNDTLDIKDALSNLLILPRGVLQERLNVKARELLNTLNLTPDYNPALIKEIEKFLALKTVREGLFRIQELETTKIEAIKTPLQEGQEATSFSEFRDDLPLVRITQPRRAIAIDEVYDAPDVDPVPEIPEVDPFDLFENPQDYTQRDAERFAAVDAADIPITAGEINRDIVVEELAKVDARVAKAPESKKAEVAQKGIDAIRKELRAEGVSKDVVDEVVDSSMAKVESMRPEEVASLVELRARLDKEKFDTKTPEEEVFARAAFRQAFDDKLKEGLSEADAFQEARRLIDNDLQSLRRVPKRTTLSDELKERVLAIEKDITDKIIEMKNVPGKIGIVVKDYIKPSIDIEGSVDTYKSLLDKYVQLLKTKPEQISVINKLIQENAPVSSLKQAGLSEKNAKKLKELGVPFSSIFNF